MVEQTQDSHLPSARRLLAPPVGRALRILIGLLLMANVAPLYARVGARFIVLTMIIGVALVVVYSVALLVLSRLARPLPPWLSAVAAAAIVVVVYLVGAPGGLLFGQGEGELAAVTFLGVSLLIAGVRSDPGCEVMAISRILIRRDAPVGCLLFSPIDHLERRLRRRPSS